MFLSLFISIHRQTDKPRKIIDLEDCVIDGIWHNDDLYTFTIRSLINDNMIYYLVNQKSEKNNLRVLLVKMKLKTGSEI